MHSQLRNSLVEKLKRFMAVRFHDEGFKIQPSNLHSLLRFSGNKNSRTKWTRSLRIVQVMHMIELLRYPQTAAICMRDVRRHSTRPDRKCAALTLFLSHMQHPVLEPSRPYSKLEELENSDTNQVWTHSYCQRTRVDVSIEEGIITDSTAGASILLLESLLTQSYY